MAGSGTIRILKRGGGVEDFDGLKLAAALWRTLGGGREGYHQSLYLSDAVRFYLVRGGRYCVSSAAIFEMCVRLLCHIGRTAAAAPSPIPPLGAAGAAVATSHSP